MLVKFHIQSLATILNELILISSTTWTIGTDFLRSLKNLLKIPE